MSWVEGRRVVVTGATSGIGREVAGRLASLGAHVVLACRNRERAEEVAAAIDAEHGPARTAVMTVDTSDERSVRAFARDFERTYGSLDVLVNNAGVLPRTRQTTDRGLEVTFATNVLGYHLVTSELLEALAAGAPSRVVNVASTFASAPDLDDLQFERRPYDAMAAYAQSKACDRMLTWAYARRLPTDRTTFNAMAPGLVLGTDLYRHLDDEARRGLEAYGSRSLAEGAETAVWLASSAEVGAVTGRFFEQGAEVACEFRDEVAEERLWQVCERLTGRVEPRR